jgi:hypothetical protein
VSRSLRSCAALGGGDGFGMVRVTICCGAFGTALCTAAFGACTGVVILVAGIRVVGFGKRGCGLTFSLLVGGAVVGGGGGGVKYSELSEFGGGGGGGCAISYLGWSIRNKLVVPGTRKLVTGADADDCEASIAACNCAINYVPLYCHIYELFSETGC